MVKEVVGSVWQIIIGVGENYNFMYLCLQESWLNLLGLRMKMIFQVVIVLMVS